MERRGEGNEKGGEQGDGLIWNIWMAHCVCVFTMSPKTPVYVHKSVCVSFRRTICHSSQSEVWKRAPGCESALHSSPESLQFRNHLIPSLTLHAPVRAPRWRGIMKLFWTVQRCDFAVPHECAPYKWAAEWWAGTKERGKEWGPFNHYVMIAANLSGESLTIQSLKIKIHQPLYLPVLSVRICTSFIH